jgi:hypothetical protein
MKYYEANKRMAKNHHQENAHHALCKNHSKEKYIAQSR